MMRAIGLMSGTSCDGVDAVLLELRDVDVPHEPVVLGHAHHGFPTDLQAELRDPMAHSLERLAELHYELADHYATAVRALPRWSSAEVCGVHGQTVWHAPPSRGPRTPTTLQLGSTGALAQALGCPVVGDLRAADLALGGEGAPITPFAHWFFTPPERAGRLVVNVGGIANFTFVAPALDDVVASDIGPGMMVVDAFARHVSGGAEACDRDGRLSRAGTPNGALVDEMLHHPFFRRALPRSTGREDFGEAYLVGLLDEYRWLAPADLVASAVEAAARTIAAVADDALPGVTEIVLTGGGALHPGLFGRVRQLADPRPVVQHERGALAPLHHEPAAMALIAARTLRHRPCGLPRVTGARRPAILGHVHWPST
jgi:anhydro-N-acetylmuramic acid kinase